MGIFGKTDSKPAERRRAAPAPPAPPPGAGDPALAALGRRVRDRRQDAFKGEITGDEHVLVEGLVEGTIRITGHLRVGPGGTVKATVSAQSVVVAGELVGDCHAAERVEIEAAGRLTGNIRAPRVVIVEGATFRGTSDMSPRGGPRLSEKA